MANRRATTDINQYRRRKRRAGNFRWVLMALLLLACASAGYFFSLSPFFAVTYITVSGNQTVSAERLRWLSGVEMGQNIFSVNLKQIERWLKIEPMVATAQIGRHLPGTISIEISERKPVAVLATGQAFVQIDDSGLVLRRMRELDTISLPILSGVRDFLPGIVPGSRIESEDMQVALAVLNGLPAQSQAAITEIDVTDSQKIRIYTLGGIEVRVGGASNIAEKYVLADNIIHDAQLSGKASRINYIDISSTEKPVIFYYTQ